ncbi:hypothetical protein H5410_003712 [Solanum commersonii]|uniref:Transposase-associated domain-containing protein n=1 Tax=Solanum commersonii TaxID=4109 RepID=A0A9J6B5V3_SOLCO|nr:hypothetical protein H5410_003712 [Solanum commersonii]
MDHRLWMYNMHYETGVGLKLEFIDGVRNFIEHTMTLDIFKNNGLVRCPCSASKRNRPNRNDESDIDPLFPPISIFNQNGRGSKKRGKQGFTNMEMQLAVIHIFLNCPEIQPYVNLLVNTWGNEAIYTKKFKWLRNYVIDVELETTLQHPQNILEEVYDDEILNVEEEIYENEENESFDDEEWDDNENETTEEEEWENDRIETNKFKAILDQGKRLETVLGVARCTLEEKELGRTPISPEVFKKTHVRKKENESHPDVWVEERTKQTFIWKEKVVRGTHKCKVYGLGSRNNVRRLQSSLEGIGSSSQAEALDGVQVDAMFHQIAKLTTALAKSERRRVVEQESMSKTVQQIQKQVMNLARGTTTSAPEESDNYRIDSEDDCVGPTP